MTTQHLRCLLLPRVFALLLEPPSPEFGLQGRFFSRMRAKRLGDLACGFPLVPARSSIHGGLVDEFGVLALNRVGVGLEQSQRLRKGQSMRRVRKGCCDVKSSRTMKAHDTYLELAHL